MAVLGGRVGIFRRAGEKKGNSRGVPLLTSKHGNQIAAQRLLGELKWRKAVFVTNFVVQLDNFWTAGRYFNKLYFINVCVKVCLILVFSFCRLNICCLILSLAQTQNLKLISFFVGHRSAEIEHPIRFSIRGTSKFSEARKVTGKTRKEVTSY